MLVKLLSVPVEQMLGEIINVCDLAQAKKNDSKNEKQDQIQNEFFSGSMDA